jgi:hypothetical protein
MPPVGSRAGTGPETASPLDLCRGAIGELDHALGRPPLELNEEVDAAERAIVRLRDALIERLRQDGGPSQRGNGRQALNQVNAVLSLVVAVEYPVAGEQRKLLEQARDALKEVRL